MTGLDKLKIVFFGSSDISAKILNSINVCNGETFSDVVKSQIDWLKVYLENKDVELLFNTDLECINKELDKIKTLKSKKIDLVLAVSQPDRLLRKKIIKNPTSIFAEKNGIALGKPKDVSNCNESAVVNKSFQYDLGVVVSYGQILKSNVLSQPRYGLVNWHPSLLPKYRGATPLQSSIFAGDKDVGLTWIEVVKKMDAGNVLFQLSKPLSDESNYFSEMEKLVEVGRNTWALAAFNQIIGRLGNTDYQTQQVEDQATYSSRLTKDDRLVNPQALAAKKIYNHWRAYLSFPKTSFNSIFFKQEVKIVEAELEGKDTFLEEVIYQGNEWVQTDLGSRKNTYLKCKDSHLKVKKICLQDGKIIDFTGFSFS